MIIISLPGARLDDVLPAGVRQLGVEHGGVDAEALQQNLYPGMP